MEKAKESGIYVRKSTYLCKEDEKYIENYSKKFFSNSSTDDEVLCKI